MRLRGKRARRWRLENGRATATQSISAAVTPAIRIHAAMDSSGSSPGRLRRASLASSIAAAKRPSFTIAGARLIQLFECVGLQREVISEIGAAARHKIVQGEIARPKYVYGLLEPLFTGGRLQTRASEFGLYIRQQVLHSHGAQVLRIKPQ